MLNVNRLKEIHAKLLDEQKRVAPNSQPLPLINPSSEVDLTWLLPEIPARESMPRRLTERQQDTLIAMYKRENDLLHGGMTISQAANQNNFYKRLQDRRLVVLVECTEGYRGVHQMKWQLTHMGRSIASGLSDLPF